MARKPSPIHRDPELDGDDYGCYSERANRAVVQLVERVDKLILTHELKTAAEVVGVVREALTRIGEGATDTVVKENVFLALDEALSTVGIYVDADLIHGW